MAGDIYEPRIRCAEAYRDYVNQLYANTTLDRNQIMRLMMFVAPFSGLFQSTVEKKLRQGRDSIPSPIWTPKADLLWLTQGGEGHQLQDKGAEVINVGTIGSGNYRIAL